MQQFVNNSFTPETSLFQKFDDPFQNEAFNKATHPANKPTVAKHIFALDSRQRDYNFYPNANSYTIKLPDRYRNVTGLELKAAMLPRTEYNVNSSNKYLDVVIGDYITKIRALNKRGSAIITLNGEPYANNNPTTNIPLIIDPPILSGSHIIPEQAIVEVDLNPDSTIKSYNIINAGSGYSQSNPPKISLADFNSFEVSVGRNYIAKLREGQYTIGGNPQFTDNKNSTSFQSWVPSNLMCEIENAITYSILKDNNVANSTDYCYTRKSWTSVPNTTTPSTATNDYPLLFCSRLMSQYPSLDSYSTTTASRTSPDQYETNSCKYNRIYNTNCLIFKSDALPPGIFTDDVGFEYDVLTYDTISSGNGITKYILYCKLVNPFQQIAGKFWTGLSPTDTNYKLSHWEFMFATGEHNIVNSAGLLGYSKRNYFMNTYNIPIEVSHISGTVNNTTIIPSGLTYSADNDYYMVGDPEYVTLSFRSKYSGSDSEINSRVDSQENSNIDRVFACLIFDTVQPAVLQDVSSGKNDSTIGSLGYDNNNLNSFMNFDNTLNEVKQLTGNTGNQNTSYNRPPGQLKAMKGADFDRKIVEFPQPVAQLTDLSIRFTKFSKLGGQGTDYELYDFQGKEHLLLFEITCGDLMTGRRF